MGFNSTSRLGALLNWKSAGFLGLFVIIVLHVAPWLADRRNLRRLPGPFFAQFTSFWLGSVASSGHRCEAIYELHEKHGA
jgi:benzoate 4-monooxygenase